MDLVIASDAVPLGNLRPNFVLEDGRRLIRTELLSEIMAYAILHAWLLSKLDSLFVTPNYRNTFER
jgi:hypothetical protein